MEMSLQKQKLFVQFFIKRLLIVRNNGVALKTSVIVAP